MDKVNTMSRVEEIERAIEQLMPEEFSEISRWMAELDSDQWDRQFEADVNAGKSEDMAEKALRDHAAGLSTDIR